MEALMHVLFTLFQISNFTLSGKTLLTSLHFILDAFDTSL